MSKYGKLIASVLYFVAVAVYGFLSDNTLSTEEWVLVVTAFFTAILTYVVPAVPEWPWLKTVAGVSLVVLGVLVNVILGGISQAEWIQLLIAFLGAFGIAAAPATSDNGVVARP